MEPEPSVLLLLIDYPILLQINPLNLIGGLVLVAFFLICSALISGSEVAFFSLTQNDITKDELNPSTERILKLLEKPRYLLSTILVTNNFINIFIILASSSMIMKNILPADGETFPFCGPKVTEYINVIIEIGVVTYLLVLFGEVAPKVYASKNNLGLAGIMSRPLLFLRSLFRPINYLLVNSTGVIEKKLDNSENGNVVSMQDIDQAIELAIKDTEYGDQDIDMLKGIVKFGNITVTQVMCSRVDAKALDEAFNYHQVLDFIKEYGFSRLPVFKENFDEIIGILYAKDVVQFLDEGEDFDWKKLLHPPLFVPESKKIDDLLREFQSKRIHMAIVVDEYGGSEGIVTLEDIVEEIVGEIKDEFDEPDEIEFTKIDNYNFVFEGKTMLNDVCRIVGIDRAELDIKNGVSDSIAGLFLELYGKIPKKNIKVECNNIGFTVVSVNNRRIEEVKLTLPSK